jgi:hypothetical protein
MIIDQLISVVSKGSHDGPLKISGHIESSEVGSQFQVVSGQYIGSSEFYCVVIIKSVAIQ